MARKPRFIQKAIDPEHKGDFRRKAESAGMTTAAYARQEEHASGRLGKQARLAETLMDLSHKRKKTSMRDNYD